MKHPQIEWIRGATEPQRTYRRMVVGWQNVNSALNAYLSAFNDAFLKEEKKKISITA
ncbi:MAG: hypothetical protein SFY80_07730 [Verrucomicrobiota bacterium]|nr:hypothetical protein [Verrucomicrobiota bacterium]